MQITHFKLTNEGVSIYPFVIICRGKPTPGIHPIDFAVSKTIFG